MDRDHTFDLPDLTEDFPDYSPVELTQILDLMLEKSEYRMVYITAK